MSCKTWEHREATSLCPGVLWVLFHSPKNPWHLLLCALIPKQFKLFTVLCIISGENIVTVSENDGAQLGSHVKEKQKGGVEHQGKRWTREKSHLRLQECGCNCLWSAYLPPVTHLPDLQFPTLLMSFTHVQQAVCSIEQIPLKEKLSLITRHLYHT